ncbi:1,4-dihydroxy-2-naphthoate prenyltransferase [Corynebacterium phocae]|uniref:1,4-dihydroxy-2-naphthoate octaprenyltransferase n=1 Tax=Corynebacterium phocae TaxID=161895 RepID=A0A1L7D162_9CORY|nr:1,4-dihydroxy-2-naphthoate polyprenyltransferase [Corynebacterium phocae]APT91840.1 1,4-dihydroxy-2-naphthoate prenyltransferase [Corynebacterium phocae]
MTDFRNWFLGARPHTWPNAIAPVIAGSGAAAAVGGFHSGRALLALAVSMGLIVGVNYANDYSDGIRGTDDERSGPVRLTASRLAKPAHVKYAAFASLALAGIAGVWLSLAANAPWLIIMGCFCITAAWFYTGGKNPYGYRGYGELAIFIFFGLVAVLGTEYTQAGHITGTGLALAVGIGAMSSGVNLANNIRDLRSDARAGKITLAVKLGNKKSRRLFTAALLTPAVLTLLVIFAHPLAILAWAYLPFAIKAIRIVNRGARGKELIPVLAITGRGMLVWALITALVAAL